jgi:hypothetical protein
MKKAKVDSDLRTEYSRNELGEGLRGKHYSSYTKGNNLVLLKPEVAKVFPTEEEVNNALLGLMEIARKSAGITSRSAGRRKKNTG